MFTFTTQAFHKSDGKHLKAASRQNPGGRSETFPADRHDVTLVPISGLSPLLLSQLKGFLSEM